MAKAHYLNFADYAMNDTDFLMRTLTDRLYTTKSKVEFKDGTTYHVTKSGSRYWQKGDYMHREDGPASMYMYGNLVHCRYYLFSAGFSTDIEHQTAVDRLNFLRNETNNEIESLVEEIAKNIQWDDRQKLWKSILQGSDNTTDMLKSLKKLSAQYQKLTKMSKKFIFDFS
jgi:hypothetical protein